MMSASRAATPDSDTMSAKRVLLIGATGVFGRRLAGHLATVPGIELILTARSASRSNQLAVDLRAAGALGKIEAIALDHGGEPALDLRSLRPWLVIDASGPFQSADYRVAEAALRAGAHAIDLADAQEYISGYGAALDAKARACELVALTGASSTPALSHAAVAAVTADWRRIDTIDIAIMPGGRSEVGTAVIEAILSYVGRPVPVWREGRLQSVHGWIGPRPLDVPGLGQRRVSPVATIDAQALSETFHVNSRVTFAAGLESRIEHYGLSLIARFRRAGWLGDVRWLTPFLVAARSITRLTTSDTGAMSVEVAGIDDAGRCVFTTWLLLARNGDGPHVPTLPAVAAVRALLAGALAPGARSAAGAVTLAQIEAEMTKYDIATSTVSREITKSLFERVLGVDTFAALPRPVQEFHGVDTVSVWHGYADIERGRGLVARMVGYAVGLPLAGRGVPVTVTVDKTPDGAAEIWTRVFGGRRFSSRLQLAPGGELTESFGPFTFTLNLVATAQTLSFPVTAWRLGWLRLPRVFAPTSVAHEYVDDSGRFRFDVRLSFCGLLVHYRGWLTPAR
jgi:hypothetical protein